MAEGVYIIEPAGKYVRLLFKVNRVFALERSPYQEVMLAEIEGFGRSLLLDKFIQSTERDEYIYHELLVHPAMAMHLNPERVLIIGGGEGATLREVLKHNTVKEAVMVDIDPVVVEFSKRYLEHMHQGSFNDPRARVYIMDGYEYVKKAPSGYFDVVIMDLTDPYASEIAKPLYSREAFAEIKRVLKADGVVATQAGSSYFYPEEYRYVLESVKANFKHVAEYWFWVPSFGLNVNFVVGSDAYRLEDVVGKMDEVLKSRGVKTKLVSGRLVEGLLKIGVLYPY
ncbi:MAG: methyltransferase domain-containing protein [Desulfurococcaceae archaeon]|nr:methyltransferase domain-containing protein [Desulfurococcaceae archaeon]